MKINHLIFLLILLISLKYSQQFSLRNLAQADCYGISIDAGSSGNKVYVHTWKCSTYSKYITLSSTPTPCPKGICNKKLAGFIQEDDNEFKKALQDYFNTVFKWIDDTFFINNQQMKSLTPIILGATAGMRNLEKNKQIRIIDQTRKILADSGYLFPKDQNLQKQWCKILDGKEEGAFLWLAFNIAQSTLTPLNTSYKNTVASIDIGGASSQIAFIPGVADDAQYRNEFNYDLFIKRFNSWHIYTVSHQNYGNDEARKRVHYKLEKKTNPDGKKYIESPCFPQGYDAINLGGLGIGVTDMITDENNNSSEIYIIGKPDINTCLNYIRNYVKGDKSCLFSNKKQCGVQNKYQSIMSENTQIHGTTLLCYAAMYLGLIDVNSLTGIGSFTMKQFKEKLDLAFKRQWTDIVKLYEGKYSDQKDPTVLYQNSRNLLFGSSYAYVLVTEGYNIDENKVINTTLQVSLDQANLMQSLSQETCDRQSNSCVVPMYKYE